MIFQILKWLWSKKDKKTAINPEASMPIEQEPIEVIKQELSEIVSAEQTNELSEAATIDECVPSTSQSDSLNNDLQKVAEILPNEQNAIEPEPAQQELSVAHQQANDITNNPNVIEAFNIGRNGLSKESVEFQECVEIALQDKNEALLEAVHEGYEEGLSEYIPPVEDSIAEINCEDLASALMGNSFNETAKDEEKKKIIQNYMFEIKKCRTWTNSKTKLRDLNQYVEEIKSYDYEKGLKAEKALALGVEINKIYDKAYKLGTSNNKFDLSELEAEASSIGATKFEIKNIKKQYEKGCSKRAKAIKEYQEKKANLVKFDCPSFALNSFHPFYIGNLPKEKHWNIFVDETGSTFDQSALLPETNSKEKGKLVALFIADNCQLPKLSYKHSTEETTSDVAKLIADILTKGKDSCGILGVNLDEMASVDIDYWFNGYARLIDLILRLLPLNSDGCILDFYVENRGGNAQENQAALQQIADRCLYQYAKIFPGNARNIKINVKCEAKKAVSVNSKFIEYNGYVDALACAWNGGRPELKKIIKGSGLLHRCLLEGNVQELALVIDKIASGQIIPITQWGELLVSPEIEVPDSIVRVLLNKLGDLLRNDIESWSKYVNEVVQYLESKAIDMNLLTKQVAFLSVNRPISYELPEKLKLLWLTTQLAEKNHRGMTSESEILELSNLIEKFYLEDAKLCCWSTLHMAVECTNVLDFEKARKTILDFAKKFNLFDENTKYDDVFQNDGQISGEWIAKITLPGLRCFGQMFSSLGQHESFMGNYEKADEYFRIALSCYKLLTENSDGDISQTMSYYVINKLDSGVDYRDLQQLMEEYLGGNFAQIIEEFAKSSDPADKYKHAIALRYLVELEKNSPSINVYVNCKKKWRVSVGHPWELIEFYRALLLSDEEERIAHLKEAYNIAKDGGITLQLIAVVILGGIYYYDPSVQAEYTNLVNKVVQSLPLLGARGEILKKQIQNKMKPLELAKAVLAFNFR